MAISSEIEKLERRWNENPSGLMFAPLAEAYRKAGNHARALEILEHGLRVHPDYVPALIVLGRCHLETGGIEEALSAFDQALTRDPVNPIALRGLAEVYERSGRPGQAVERLELLLEVDRGDTEARAVLERLRGQISQAVEAPAPAASDEPVAAVSLEPSEELTIQPEESLTSLLLEPAAASEADDLGVENLSIDPMAVIEAPPTPAEVRMPWEPVSGFGALGEPAMAMAESPEPEPEPLPLPVLEVAPEEPEPWVAPTAAEPAPEPQPELGAEVEPVAPQAPVAAVWTPLPEPVLWTPAPLPTPAEPAASELCEPAVMELELAEPASVSEPQAMETPDLPSASSEPVPPESPEAAALDWPAIESPVDGSEAAAVEASAEPGPAVEPPAVVAEEPELIVTESMAEVFVRQGHPALALAVYRQLAERSPDSESIQDAIRRLEAEAAPLLTAAVPEPARIAYRAAETGGRSVSQMLQSVLQAPPPVAATTVLPPAIEPPGEPARASHEPLSLGAVFGDEPIAPPPSPPEAQAAGEPSYDEFFGAAPTADVSASGAARDPEGEDLRQFNDWLRGLKR